MAGNHDTPLLNIYERVVSPFERHDRYFEDLSQPVVLDNALLTGSRDAAISHFAMEIGDFDAAKARLEEYNITYRVNEVASSTMRQLFFDDPDEILIELIHIPKGAR